MTRALMIHRRWLTALSLVAACGDDGASVSSTETETDASTDGADDVADDVADDNDTTEDTLEPDSSGSATESTTDASTSDTGTTTSDTDGDTEGLCGNDAIDIDETCDGTDLGGVTCEDQGYLGGDLACAADCMGFDPSGCFSMQCGDDMVSGTEDCDGEDLNGQTCELLGYDGGVLACDACAFDTDGCTMFSCGDGELNPPREECDIDDFGGNDTCELQGFGPGTLFCTEQCTVETAGCCGSNTVGGAETCDGDDLNGTSCLTLDFDGGTLVCNEDCAGFDTSGCTTCGDALVEGTEDCDGANLNGADCTTEGFFAGTLACDAGCGFDVSGCTNCGNGMVDIGEECDGADLGTATCVSLGHTGGALGCTACGLDESGCTDFPPPGADEVVITEIMQNPNATDDSVGEYIELHNPTAGTVQLQGCAVDDGAGADAFGIDLDLAIDPGGYVTLARTDMPGFTADYVYGPGNGFQLSNTSDTVRLVCGATIIDEVNYDEAAMWPDPTGASMQLDPGFLTTIDNDVPDNWCTSFNDLGNGDLGTPGTANVSCSPADFTIDFCNLQFPTTIDDLEGTQVDVFGRVFIAGLTDQTAGNDPAANVTGWVGYGPDGTDPAMNGMWTWTAAVPNPAWMDPGFPVSSNDEYMVSLTAPTAGTYDYAFRFTGDGGTTFTYCDTDGTGGAETYEIANAGAMVTQAGGDPLLLYFSEYVEGSSSNKAVEIYNPGAQGVFLDQCVIRVYSNGSPVVSGTVTPANFPIANHTVPPTGTYVICNGGAVGIPQALCDGESNPLNHSGNDALELVCNGVTIDVIGQIGFDPGAEWNVNGVGTGDETLRRDCAVTDGDPIGNDVFDPSLEWDTFPQNTFDGLGTRGCP